MLSGCVARANRFWRWERSSFTSKYRWDTRTLTGNDALARNHALTGNDTSTCCDALTCTLQQLALDLFVMLLSLIRTIYGVGVNTSHRSMHVLFCCCVCVHDRKGEQVMVNNLQMTDAQMGLESFLSKQRLPEWTNVDDYEEPNDD